MDVLHCVDCHGNPPSRDNVMKCPQELQEEMEFCKSQVRRVGLWGQLYQEGGSFGDNCTRRMGLVGDNYTRRMGLVGTIVPGGWVFWGQLYQEDGSCGDNCTFLTLPPSPSLSHPPSPILTSTPFTSLAT